MLGKLLILFILAPMLELVLLVWLGAHVGFWPTVALVVLTGTVGALLARSQGLRVLREIRAEMAEGRVPASGLLDGLLVLVGGVVLLTPGLLTDVGGLLLLFPPTRARAKRWLRGRVERMVSSGEIRVMTLGR